MDSTLPQLEDLTGWTLNGLAPRQAVDFLQLCFSNSVGKVNLKKTPGCFKARDLFSLRICGASNSIKSRRDYRAA
jgi:hypothetical protein